MNNIVMIPVAKIFPHPDNPRKNIGDISELAESIKENGILQNLTVVPYENGYRAIIGHRRLAAAKAAGLKEVPCVIRDMTLKEQRKTMLMENIQRVDLTLYEQAQGFQLMLEMGETVESIAKESGFSQSTVRRRVNLLRLDDEKFKKAEKRGATLLDYMELDKVKDPQLKNKVLDTIGTPNFKNTLKSAIEEEKTKEKLLEWERDISQFATKIEKRDYVGDVLTPMDYMKNYGYWNTSTEVVVPSDAETVQYYYIVGSRQIDLYRQEKERVETEEDRKRREITEKNKEREAKLRDISNRHFELRLEYAKAVTSLRNHIPMLCKLAFAALLASRGSYNLIDEELLGELLSLAPEEFDDDVEEMANAAAVQQPEYALFALCFATLDEYRKSYWKSEWKQVDGIYQYVYSHRFNEELDLIYSVLEELGYEMSDEERAMQNGSHPLLNSGTKVDSCSSCKASHPECDKCCNSCDTPCNALQECSRT